MAEIESKQGLRNWANEGKRVTKQAETKPKEGTHLNHLDVWVCPHCGRHFVAFKEDYGKVQQCPKCFKPVKLVDPLDRSVEE